MIKLTVKGLAQYISSSPSMQRRILQNFKYPSADEPFAMKMYYREATDCLKSFIRDHHWGEWLRQQSTTMTASLHEHSTASARRLQQNAKALLLCEKHFASKTLEILECPRFRLAFSNVSLSVIPNLLLRDGAKAKLIKLQFGGPQLPDDSVKVITQCLLDAATSQGFELPPSSAIYIDLPRDVAHTAVRGGKRTQRNIKAACETISQIWDSIPPPAKSRRSAAA